MQCISQTVLKGVSVQMLIVYIASLARGVVQDPTVAILVGLLSHLFIAQPKGSLRVPCRAPASLQLCPGGAHTVLIKNHSEGMNGPSP